VAVSTTSKSVDIIKQYILLTVVLIFHANSKEYKYEVAKEVWFGKNEKQKITFVKKCSKPNNLHKSFYQNKLSPVSIKTSHLQFLSKQAISSFYQNKPSPVSIKTIHLQFLSKQSISSFYQNKPSPVSIKISHLQFLSKQAISSFYQNKPSPVSIKTSHLQFLSK